MINGDLGEHIDSYLETGFSYAESTYDPDELLTLTRAHLLQLHKALVKRHPDPKQVSDKRILKMNARDKSDQVSKIMSLLSGEAMSSELPIPDHHPLASSFAAHSTVIRRAESVRISSPDLMDTIVWRMHNLRFRLLLIQAKGGDVEGDDPHRDEVAAMFTSLLRRAQAVHDRLESQLHPEDFSENRAGIRDRSYTPEQLETDLTGMDQADSNRFVERLFGIRERPATELLGAMEHMPYSSSGIQNIMPALEHVPDGATLCDIGCGLSLVPMIHSFLTGQKAMGVEYDPGLARFGEAAAKDLNLDVEVQNCDAREADFSKADCFYLFNPFTGNLRDQVLDRLREVAEEKPITIISLGGAKIDLPWLEQIKSGSLSVFRSIDPKLMTS